MTTTRARFRSAFTTVEVLIAVVTLGILAGLLAYGYAHLNERAYRAVMLNDLKNFQGARALYVAQSGQHPVAPTDATGYGYSDFVFEVDYWNGGPYWSLIVGHRKTDTICMATEYEGEAYWIGCEKTSRLDFTAVPGAAPREMIYDVSSGLADLGLDPEHLNRIAWSMGDGYVEGGAPDDFLRTQHIYDRNGRYRVQVVVVPDEGRPRVAARSVQVGGGNETAAPPVADFGFDQASDVAESVASSEVRNASNPSFAHGSNASAWPDTVWFPVGDEVVLDGSLSYDPQGLDIVDYEWEMAGRPSRLRGQRPKVQLMSEPWIRLTVTNSAGLSSSKTRHLAFYSQGEPVADFTWNPAAPYRGQDVTFDASLSGQTHALDLVSFDWLFADGSTASGIQTSRTFDEGGPQVVTLTVTDAAGQTSAKTDTVQVGAPQIVASWDACASYGRGYLADVVGIADAKLGQHAHYERPWSQYWTPGPPAALDLKASTADHPQVYGEVDGLASRADTTYTFIVLHQNDGTASHTLLEVQNTAGRPSPFKLYISGGNITLWANPTNYRFGPWPTGRWSTIALVMRPTPASPWNYQTAEVFVDGVSRGAQVVNRHSVVSGSVSLFADLPDAYGRRLYPFLGRVGAVQYFAGDLSAAEVQQVHAEMMAQAESGCGSLNNHTSKARFTYEPKEPAAGESVRFDASGSASAAGEIVEFRWSFGDWNDTTTTKPYVEHAFASPGRYPVQLTVVDEKGGEASATADVNVVPPYQLVSSWNFCDSYGRAFLTDATGKADVRLIQEAAYTRPWSRYWEPGPPAALRMDSASAYRPSVSGETDALAARRDSSFTVIALQQYGGSGNGTQILFATENTAGTNGTFYLSRSNGNIHIWQNPNNYTWASWPDDWSTIALQLRTRPDVSAYGQVAEVFVNGESLGSKSLPRKSLVSGSMGFFGNFRNSSGWKYNFFEGRVAAVRYYAGYLPPEKVRAAHEEMMRALEDGCALNNQHTEARFTHSPVEPAVGEEVTFDATKSRVVQGSIVRYLWDFADWSDDVSSSNPIVKHSFTSAGTKPVQLRVVTEHGDTVSVEQDVLVREPATLVAHWDACSSFGEDEIVSRGGGPTISLEQNASNPVSWYRYWQRGYPAKMNLARRDNPVVLGTVNGYTPEDTTFTALFWQNHNGAATTGGFFEYMLRSEGTSTGSGANGLYRYEGNIVFYTNPTRHTFGPWPTGWSTIAVQVRRRLYGTVPTQEVEVFVDGVSRGIREVPANRGTMSGTMNLFASGTGSFPNGFRGEVGQAAYYQGVLTEEKIRQWHQRVISTQNDCVFPPNQAPVPRLVATHILPSGPRDEAASIANRLQPQANEPVWIRDDGSYDPDGEIVRWEISHNDYAVKEGRNIAESGNADTWLTAFHPGAHPVQITVTDNDGVKATLNDTIYIDVDILEACFTHSPESPIVGEPVSFDASCSTRLGGPLEGTENYAWSFSGSTGPSTSASRDPGTRTWTAPGVYRAALTLTNSGGISRTVTRSVWVGSPPPPQRPIARIVQTPDSPIPGQRVTFSSSTSTDPDGSIVAREWRVLGLKVATSTSFYRTFPTGRHKVDLIVTDNSGLTDTASVTVDLRESNLAPVAKIRATPLTLFVGDSLSFTGVDSFDPDGEVVAYEWSFPSMGVVSGSVSGALRAPTHTGTLPLAFTVTDDDGAHATAEVMVTVLPRPVPNQEPVAQFTAQETYDKESGTFTVTLDALSSHDPDGRIVRYQWSFADGGHAEGAVVQRTLDEGVHPVTLTVTDNRGGTGQSSRDLVLVKPRPLKVKLSPTKYPFHPCGRQGMQMNARVTDAQTGAEVEAPLIWSTNAPSYFANVTPSGWLNVDRNSAFPGGGWSYKLKVRATTPGGDVGEVTFKLSACSYY